jgi:hypothetical protein
MISQLTLLPFDKILPSIKNKGEARLLVCTSLVGVKLDRALRALILTGELELILENVHGISLASHNRFDAAIANVLSSSTALLRQRFQPQRSIIKELLEELQRCYMSLKQYGEQNMAISRELEFAECKELALQKRQLADLELALCENIGLIIDMSRRAATINDFENMLLSQSIELSCCTNDRSCSKSVDATTSEEGGNALESNLIPDADNAKDNNCEAGVDEESVDLSWKDSRHATAGSSTSEAQAQVGE